MNKKNNLSNLAPVLSLLVVTASSDASITYTLNTSMTDLSSGIAYWDTTEEVTGGTLVGFHQVTSINSPNILTASSDSRTFTYDTGVASSYTMLWESSFMSSGGGTGDSGSPQISPTFDSNNNMVPLFVSDTHGGQMMFDLASEFVSGDGVYGTFSGMSGQALMTGDSGSFGSTFISGASGSEWNVQSSAIISDGTFSAAGNSYSFSWSIGGGGSGIGTISSSGSESIPEPSGISLLALSALVIGLRRRR